MAFVGVIEPGTVKRVISSVSYAKANVLILLEQGQQAGHVLFEKGDIVTARLAELTGEDALEALEEWQAGHYTLLKREQKQTESQGHVLLISLDLKTRRLLERYLKTKGYTTSIVGYPQHALQVISYIQPEVVLMHCPQIALGLSCTELKDRLTEKMKCPPLVVALETPDKPCSDPTWDCVQCEPRVNALQKILDQPWPNTRLHIKRQTHESTAKVFRPTQLPANLDKVSFVTGAHQALTEPEGVTTRDLAVLMVALVLGSGLIWALWWVGIRSL